MKAACRRQAIVKQLYDSEVLHRIYAQERDISGETACQIVQRKTQFKRVWIR